MAGNKSRNRELAALAIASGKEVKDAAATANVSERTVFNWLNDDTFQTRVRELRSELVSAAATKLAGSMSKAAEVLEKLLSSVDEHVRRHAAVKIIELGLKTTELEQLQKQVAELERRVVAMGPP